MPRRVVEGVERWTRLFGIRGDFAEGALRVESVSEKEVALVIQRLLRCAVE